jgi:hypothetical protein
MTKNRLSSVYMLMGYLVLTGCATPRSQTPMIENSSVQNEVQIQREMVVEDFVNTNRRLQTVASRIVVRGTDLCGEKIAPYFGIKTWNEDSFQHDWKRVAQDKFGLTGQIQVSNVATGSPADLAGIKEGDVVQSVNGWLAPYGKDGPVKFSEKIKELGKAGIPVNFIIRTNGEEKKIAILPTKACDFSVMLSPDDIKNAYADGKNIVVQKGMMDFFKSDEEVALVVSHELAHNSMKHIDAKKKNAMIGGIFGLLLDVAAAAGGVNTNGDFTRMASNAGGGAYSVEFELEADYVGLYFMSIAGYKIDDAPNFWRRMATNNSASITMKSSHPTAPERFLALETTVKEIKGKIDNKQPLKPEMKNK